MSWLDTSHHARVRTAGARAAEELLQAGVAAYYMDDAIAPGEIIKEWPDGRRAAVRITDGEDVVIKYTEPEAKRP